MARSSVKTPSSTAIEHTPGFIHVGPISIGKNAVISEATVIDIDTSMGDGTQLGHASSLHAGQTVPDGERWHGSPGQQTVVDNFLTVDPAPCGTLRRVAYAVYQLLTMLLYPAAGDHRCDLVAASRCRS